MPWQTEAVLVIECFKKVKTLTSKDKWTGEGSSIRVGCMGFLVDKTISSVNSDSCMSPCSFWVPFIFSCLIALARTSNTMLNKSGKSRHPFLVSDLKGKAFSFCHWVWCQQWACHSRSLSCWGMLHLYPLCWQFLSQMDVEFVKCFFCIHWKTSLHPLNKSQLTMVYDAFDVLLSSVC